MMKHAHTAASSKRLKTKLKNSELVFSGELWTSHGRDGTMEEGGGFFFLFWLKSFFFFFHRRNSCWKCVALLGWG
jgi:hypothetical protein